jgi:hypothetical protein
MDMEDQHIVLNVINKHQYNHGNNIYKNYK